MSGCGMTTELTDAELAAIVRGAMDGDGITGRFEAISADAQCRLAEHHGGDCASWQASLINEPGAAWFRWGDSRRVDWLADCVTGGCVLYRGHPGRCDEGSDDDPRFA